MDEWIELADGKKLTDTYIVKLDENNIAVYSGTVNSLSQAWKLFGSPKKTEKIHSNQYGDEADWIGYTEPVAIQLNEHDTMICMRRQPE